MDISIQKISKRIINGRKKAESSGPGRENDSSYVTSWWLLRRSHLEEGNWEVVKTWELPERRMVSSEIKAYVEETEIPGVFKLIPVTDNGKLKKSVIKISIGNALIERLWQREHIPTDNNPDDFIIDARVPKESKLDFDEQLKEWKDEYESEIEKQQADVWKNFHVESDEYRG